MEQYCLECLRIYEKFGKGKALLATDGKRKKEEVGKVVRVESPIPGLAKFVIDFGTPYVHGKEFYLHPHCAMWLGLG